MKYSILFSLIFFFRCGYKKEKEVRSHVVTGEVQYVIWVWKDLNILESFRIPLTQASKHNIDSLNRKADSLILMAKAAEDAN